MTYAIDWEPQGAVLRFSGRISISDIERATTAYQGDYRFDQMHYVIADYTRITGCEASPAEIDYVCAVDSAARLSNGHIRMAIVTTSPAVIELATRYKAQPIQAFPLKIFASLADARRWLNGGTVRP